jgi:hypothetical protein
MNSASTCYPIVPWLYHITKQLYSSAQLFNPNNFVEPRSKASTVMRKNLILYIYIYEVTLLSNLLRNGHGVHFGSKVVYCVWLNTIGWHVSLCNKGQRYMNLIIMRSIHHSCMALLETCHWQFLLWHFTADGWLALQFDLWTHVLHRTSGAIWYIATGILGSTSSQCSYHYNCTWCLWKYGFPSFNSLASIHSCVEWN